MTSPSLSIVIVNYKTPELIKQCAKSIVDSSLDDIEIIIVDNCSCDNSEKEIVPMFPSVIWINNHENEGFGRANNLGASYSRGEYILFLNSDVILFKQTLEESLNYIQNNQDIGVLGCKLLNEDKTVQKSVYHYVGDFMAVLKDNLIVDFFYKEKTPKIKAVMGAFMLLPKKVFNEVKGFDPDFFMYAEELELCNRVAELGYRIEYFENAEAIHLHGGSSNGSDWSNKQNYLSNALLFLKVRGLFGYSIYHLLMFITFLSNVILLWKMDKTYRKDFLLEQKYYFSNFATYFKIPFLYSQSTGNGKRCLKRA